MDPIISLDSNGAAWLMDIVLGDGDLLRLDRVRVGKLACETGRVLVTVSGRQGMGRDIELAPGERCTVTAAGACVLVEAVGTVRLTLQARRGHWPWDRWPRARLVRACVSTPDENNLRRGEAPVARGMVGMAAGFE